MLLNEISITPLPFAKSSILSSLTSPIASIACPFSTVALARQSPDLLTATHGLLRSVARIVVPVMFSRSDFLVGAAPITAGVVGAFARAFRGMPWRRAGSGPSLSVVVPVSGHIVCPSRGRMTAASAGTGRLGGAMLLLSRLSTYMAVIGVDW